MARLIDADALWYRTFSCEDAADVRKEIEIAPTVDAVEVVRWIPVTERLPEVGCEVLTYCNRNKNKYAVGMYSDTYKGFFVNQFWNGDISHWMPLPEPPKEE